MSPIIWIIQWTIITPYHNLEFGCCLSNFTGNDLVSVVNSNPKFRSSGMVLFHTAYPSTNLNSGSDFTVADEPVIIFTSDTVVGEDEPVWTCQKGGCALCL